MSQEKPAIDVEQLKQKVVSAIRKNMKWKEVTLGETCLEFAEPHGTLRLKVHIGSLQEDVTLRIEGGTAADNSSQTCAADFNEIWFWIDVLTPSNLRLPFSWLVME